MQLEVAEINLIIYLTSLFSLHAHGDILYNSVEYIRTAHVYYYIT